MFQQLSTDQTHQGNLLTCDSLTQASLPQLLFHPPFMLKSVDLQYGGIGNFRMSRLPNPYTGDILTQSREQDSPAHRNKRQYQHLSYVMNMIGSVETLYSTNLGTYGERQATQRPVSSSASQHASQAKLAMHPTMKNFLPVAQPACF